MLRAWTPPSGGVPRSWTSAALTLSSVSPLNSLTSPVTWTYCPTWTVTAPEGWCTKIASEAPGVASVPLPVPSVWST